MTKSRGAYLIPNIIGLKAGQKTVLSKDLYSNDAFIQMEITDFYPIIFSMNAIFFRRHINPRLMKRVTVVIIGTSMTGFIVVILILKPKYPF